MEFVDIVLYVMYIMVVLAVGTIVWSALRKKK